jgi:hypothetical protein
MMCRRYYPVARVLAVVLALAVMFGGVSYLYVKSNLQKKLQSVTDPVKFARSFDPEGKTPVNFKLECRASINCEGNEYFVSPYFPYAELGGDLVDENISHWRTIWRDPVWDLYWVGVEGGRYQMNQVFFGPYKK